MDYCRVPSVKARVRDWDNKLCTFVDACCKPPCTMSGAVRSRPRRSAVRSAASLPYARPKQAPKTKSPWAIATLLSYLNPLRLRDTSRSLSPIDVDDEEDDDEEDEPDADAVSDDSPPESLSARGRQMAHTLAAPVQPPQPPAPYLLPDSSSPKKNLETVASFLEQRRGQTISPLEAEGLISLIHKSTPTEKPEPFRFSTSLPSTPARGNSPAAPHDIFTIGASPVLNASPRAGSPRKTLAKNPNGTLRWPGGGSARPSKNRYASPAFGTPARATSEHLVFRDPPPQTDASPKRRRLETPPAATPPPIPRSAAPAPSPNRVAASQYFPFPLSTPASSPVSAPSTTPAAATTPARAALNQVKTIPVHPSPLRQAWGGSPASSVSSNGSSPAQAQGTPTKAATLLTALIRDVDAESPRRSAAVRNPYQSASPVSVRVTNTHPPEGARRKRTRATGRLEEREKEVAAKEAEKEKEREREVVPPQAIIEATLPKGSKRSRPPAHFNASASLDSLSAPEAQVSPRRSPRLEPQHIEADEAEEKEKNKEEHEAGAPAAKRARPAGDVNGVGSAPVNGNVNGVVNGALKKAAEPAPAPMFPASVSAPSFGNTKPGSGASGPGFPLGSSASTGSGSGFSTSTSTGTSSSTSGFEFRPGPKPLLASAPKEPSKLRYSFAPPTPPPVGDKDKEEGGSGKKMFAMGPPPVPAPVVAKSTTNDSKVPPSPAPRDPKAAARALPATALPPFVFSVLSALTNAPAPGPHDKARDAARRLDKSKLPAFAFDLSAPPALDKGKAKETAPVQGFNWAAAGAAPPKSASSAAGSWTCDTCMLTNKPEVLDQCAVCEAPRKAPPAKPAVQGFNWAAAGVKPPKPALAPGTWTCGTCMLSNGPEAVDKCAVCESDR
ncbi:hypothetical protein DFH09DRAFT_506400 [Mycena vulgaris]|nr:hypothetical protein DFH09DRAFT_506400 [Mycena vulgaris]